MSQTPATPSPFVPLGSARMRHDPLFVRYAVVALIAVLLFIPLILVEDLIEGRAALYREVVAGISRTWGGEQTLSGPYLLLPFTQRVKKERVVPEEGKSYGRRVTEVSLETGTFVILPAGVSFKADLAPEERQRGIYRAQVYTAALDMNGSFTLPNEEALRRIAPALVEVDFAHAFMVMGLTYPSALRTAGPFVWDGTPLTAEPGTQPFREEQLASGFRIPLNIAWRTGRFDFSQRLVFTGSGGIRFSPAGETTDIAVTSAWPHPSFQGSVLPASHQVTEAGFSAVWSVPSLARSYPNLGRLDSWKGSLDAFSVGVDIYQTSTHYKLVERAVKYGILFIGLTFLTFVVFELGLGSRLHPMQYGIVGLSLVIFYLALLSLAEHVSFLVAYACAAGCILLMTSLYVGAALRSVRQGLGIAVLLGALYALLYTILQMEDYALLMGTALILVMLAALMVVSRNLGRTRA